MVHPEGNGIAQNTKYDEITKLYSFKPETGKRLNTTLPQNRAAYDHVSYVNMLFCLS